MNDQQQMLEAKQLIAAKQYEEAKTVLRGLPENATAQQWLAKLESVPSGETKAKLEEARDLIQQHKYAKARAVLGTVADHPTAQKWLAQINKVALDSAQPAPPAAVSGTPAAESPIVPLSGTPAAGSPIVPLSGVSGEAQLRAASVGGDDSPVAQMMERAQTVLADVQIDMALGGMVLIVAVVTGVLAGLLDKILGMPGLLLFTFGGFVALLNGPIYAMRSEKIDRAAWIMSAVSGLVSILVWYLITAIILGAPNFLKDDGNSHNMYRRWFDEHANFFKALITGPIMGLLGLGWYWAVPHLPQNLDIELKRD